MTDKNINTKCQQSTAEQLCRFIAKFKQKTRKKTIFKYTWKTSIQDLG